MSKKIERNNSISLMNKDVFKIYNFMFYVKTFNCRLQSIAKIKHFFVFIKLLLNIKVLKNKY